MRAGRRTAQRALGELDRRGAADLRATTLRGTGLRHDDARVDPALNLTDHNLRATTGGFGTLTNLVISLVAFHDRHEAADIPFV